MVEERYYRLSLLKKIDSGAEWKYIYLRVYRNGELEITHKEINSSNDFLNSKLEEITKEKCSKDLNDSGYDFTYG